MTNLKVMGAGIIVTFVLAILAGVFIPLIQSQFEGIQQSQPITTNLSIVKAQQNNATIASGIQILYVLPVLIVVFGVIVSIFAGFMLK